MHIQVPSIQLHFAMATVVMLPCLLGIHVYIYIHTIYIYIYIYIYLYIYIYHVYIYIHTISIHICIYIYNICTTITHSSSVQKKLVLFPNGINFTMSGWNSPWMVVPFPVDQQIEVLGEFYRRHQSKHASFLGGGTTVFEWSEWFSQRHDANAPIPTTIDNNKKIRPKGHNNTPVSGDHEIGRHKNLARGMLLNGIPSGTLTVCYWKWPNHSWCTHQTSWFSVVMLVYQRVPQKMGTHIARFTKYSYYSWVQKSQFPG